MGICMSNSEIFEAGNYRYMPGVMQYSGGVVAMPGYTIERRTFRRVVELDEGFVKIAKYLTQIGRPLTSFCACELRSPAPFDELGFEQFNRRYIVPLTQWGIFQSDVNPVARTNVCPAFMPPTVPGFYAFSYTVPTQLLNSQTFVVAGSGEVPEGKGNYRDHIICPNDVSPTGMKTKANWVLTEMERRMQSLGVNWSHMTSTQVYSVRDIHPVMETELVKRGAATMGLNWQWARPPVVGLDFEMDVRGIIQEHLID